MTRKTIRQGNTRERIAAAAARIMAEDGIDDFALAKRKAVRQLGLEGGRLALPGNDEIEAELRAYRSLYQVEEHSFRIAELQRVGRLHGKGGKRHRDRGGKQVSARSVIFVLRDHDLSPITACG